jgi:hypothetical protein
VTAAAADVDAVVPAQAVSAPATVPPVPPTAATAAPAGAITEASSRVPVEVPERILRRQEARVAGVVKIIFRQPPIIAGQRRADYYDLVQVVLQDYRPAYYDEVAVLRQIVDAEWDILTFQQVRTWLFNAEIAEGIIQQFADQENDDDDDQLQKNDASDRSLSRLRTVRLIVFGAVAGDGALIERIEGNLGVGRVGFSAYTAKEMLRDIRSHIFADGAMNAAITRRNSGIRHFEKLRDARYKRFELHQPTARDLGIKSIEEYVESRLTPE